MITQFCQTALGGLTLGSIYGMVGLGFTLIYNLTSIINFTQGEFVVWGAFIMIFLTSGLGLSFIPAVLITILCVGTIGMLFQRLIMRRIKFAPLVISIVATIGGAVFMRGCALLLWGRDPVSAPAILGHAGTKVGGVVLNPQTLIIIGISICSAFAFHLFFNKNYFGKAMKACTENIVASSALGIKVDKMILISFFFGGALGAIGGVVVAPVTFMGYYMGSMFTLKGIISAVFGGMGSYWGAILGGFVIGLLEAISSGYISSQFKEAIVFCCFFIVLAIRPQGLFGKKAM